MLFGVVEFSWLGWVVVKFGVVIVVVIYLSSACVCLLFDCVVCV